MPRQTRLVLRAFMQRFCALVRGALSDGARRSRPTTPMLLFNR
jgi:hypothetical protein